MLKSRNAHPKAPPKIGRKIDHSGLGTLNPTQLAERNKRRANATSDSVLALTTKPPEPARRRPRAPAAPAAPAVPAAAKLASAPAPGLEAQLLAMQLQHQRELASQQQQLASLQLALLQQRQQESAPPLSPVAPPPLPQTLQRDVVVPPQGRRAGPATGGTVMEEYFPFGQQRQPMDGRRRFQEPPPTLPLSTIAPLPPVPDALPPTLSPASATFAPPALTAAQVWRAELAAQMAEKKERDRLQKLEIEAEEQRFFNFSRPGAGAPAGTRRIAPLDLNASLGPLPAVSTVPLAVPAAVVTSPEGVAHMARAGTLGLDQEALARARRATAQEQLRNQLAEQQALKAQRAEAARLIEQRDAERLVREQAEMAARYAAEEAKAAEAKAKKAAEQQALLDKAAAAQQRLLDEKREARENREREQAAALQRERDEAERQRQVKAAAAAAEAAAAAAAAAEAAVQLQLKEEEAERARLQLEHAQSQREQQLQMQKEQQQQQQQQPAGKKPKPPPTSAPANSSKASSTVNRRMPAPPPERNNRGVSATRLRAIAKPPLQKPGAKAAPAPAPAPAPASTLAPALSRTHKPVHPVAPAPAVAVASWPAPPPVAVDAELVACLARTRAALLGKQMSVGVALSSAEQTLQASRQAFELNDLARQQVLRQLTFGF